MQHLANKPILIVLACKVCWSVFVASYLNIMSIPLNIEFLLIVVVNMVITFILEFIIFD